LANIIKLLGGSNKTVYNYLIHSKIEKFAQKNLPKEGWGAFYPRLIANAEAIHNLYFEIYGQHPQGEAEFEHLLQTMANAYQNRSADLHARDLAKAEKDHWFLSNEIAGMSLYVDRFCGNLKKLPEKFDYLKRLGVNFLHLMPIFESPEDESDGGYAVSNFRKVDKRFGTLADLQKVRQKMADEGMYLMLDIVLNHTSHHHDWAKRAKAGDKTYQDYFYFYDDRTLPDKFEETMPDIFPEASPGSFSYILEVDKYVMTVFHHYQWDLNYTNPRVLVDMLDNIFFYANLGVDILRIDAPAFIWKQLGTTCQNLPQAHTLLRLIKQCVAVATPGTALLGEAIVAPQEIMKYFGTEHFTAQECDFAYNATQMALQWDTLATGDTRVMLAAQPLLQQKPWGTSWITYTRCHDDIGLGYDDWMIAQAGYNPYEHRKFIKDYYSGAYEGSPAMGALFSVNPKTQDARISGSLAALCGLEKAIQDADNQAISLSIQKILLMQAHSFFLGGIPMLFYGDEVAYTNDYSYLDDEGKNYDNRWMHRPMIDWQKNKRIDIPQSIENQVFSGTQKLLTIRKKLPEVADLKNLTWLRSHNPRIAAYVRTLAHKKLFCLFNFSNKLTPLTWYVFRELGDNPREVYDHWREKKYSVGKDYEHLLLEPYHFYLFEMEG
jgi:amylosucrase